MDFLAIYNEIVRTKLLNKVILIDYWNLYNRIEFKNLHDFVIYIQSNHLDIDTRFYSVHKIKDFIIEVYYDNKMR